MVSPTHFPTAWRAWAAAPLDFEPVDSEHLSLFNVAVGACLRDASGVAEGRRMLRRLIVALDLSYDEAGRALGVTGETVRRWERSMVLVPTRRLSVLTGADDALSRLLGLFRPERLPVAIRRPAALFDGESALDWILRGRIQEVADRYDVALSYQV